MKSFFSRIKVKIINFFKWLYSELKDWHNFIILAVVAACLFALCVIAVCFSLMLADGKIHLLYSAGLVFAFWAGPFTPFWPLCITITLCIRKFIQKIWKPQHNKNKKTKD